MRRSETDEAGRVYIEGEAVWSGVESEHVAMARFYRCPIATINEGATHDIMRINRLVSVDGVALADVVRQPTGALLDGLDAVRIERSIIDAKRREREARNAKAMQAAKRSRRVH